MVTIRIRRFTYGVTGGVLATPHATGYWRIALDFPRMVGQSDMPGFDPAGLCFLL